MPLSPRLARAEPDIAAPARWRFAAWSTTTVSLSHSTSTPASASGFDAPGRLCFLPPPAARHRGARGMAVLLGGAGLR